MEDIGQEYTDTEVYDLDYLDVLDFLSEAEDIEWKVYPETPGNVMSADQSTKDFMDEILMPLEDSRARYFSQRFRLESFKRRGEKRFLMQKRYPEIPYNSFLPEVANFKIGLEDGIRSDYLFSESMELRIEGKMYEEMEKSL